MLVQIMAVENGYSDLLLAIDACFNYTVQINSVQKGKALHVDYIRD